MKACPIGFIRTLLLAAAFIPLFAASALSLQSTSYVGQLADYGQGGRREVSASYNNTPTIQEAGAAFPVSASYTGRSGFNAGLPLPSEVAGLISVSTYNVSLQWVAPAADLEYSTGTVAQYLIRYSTTGPITNDADFASATVFANAFTPLAPSKTENHTLTGLPQSPAFYIAIRCANTSGVLSWISSIRWPMQGPPPQISFAVDIATTSSGVVLSWLPVSSYSNFTQFINPASPLPQELIGFHVYRATAPIQATWTLLTPAVLSTNTLTWTDVSGGPGYYYGVTSLNSVSESSMPMLRSSSDGSAVIVAPDGFSTMRIPAQLVPAMIGTPGQAATACLVIPSSATENPAQGIMESVQFTPYRGGVPYPQFSLGGMATLNLHYNTIGSGGASSALAAAAMPAPQPENLSAFWNNGANWMQLYGQLDSADQLMSIQTPYFGPYQLRLAERTGQFGFNAAGLSNRFITPNGDNKNDNVVFNFDNPNNSPVSGKIFDVRGRTVVGTLPAGPLGTSLIWDGTASGRPVPMGTYIYQISSEGKTYTGTVFVIK